MISAAIGVGLALLVLEIRDAWRRRPASKLSDRALNRRIARGGPTLEADAREKLERDVLRRARSCR